MAGLLDILSRNPGLLSPMQGASQLAPAVSQANTLLAQPIPSALPAPSQRGRVNPLRVLDNFLFDGNGIGAAVEQERTRLDNEANRPRLLAQQQREQDMVAALPPALQLAYATNKAETGKALASNYEGYTLGAGGLRGGLGGIVSSAPTYSTVNDTIYANDRGTSTPTATAPPGFDDMTQRQKVEADAALGAGSLDVNRYAAQTGRMNAETNAATAGTTLSPGQVRFDANNNPVANVRANTATNPVAVELQGRIDSTRRDVLPTTQRMRSLITSGDVITGYGAGPRLEAARALAATGNEEAKRKVAATQEYQNLSGALRVGIAKSLGANPSNADIILLEKITAGDVGQSPEALLSTIGQAEGRANSLIEDVQRQIASGGNQTPASAPPTPAEARAILRSRGVPGY